MALLSVPNLPKLFLEDETAWLDAMVELLEAGAYSDLDYGNLMELLKDMAGRERREVESRLVVLLMHILKWQYQPSHRSKSWQLSIITQRQQLQRLIGKGVLRNHADGALQECFAMAVELAMSETGLPKASFPDVCEWTIPDILAFDTSQPLNET